MHGQTIRLEDPPDLKKNGIQRPYVFQHVGRKNNIETLMRKRNMLAVVILDRVVPLLGNSGVGKIYGVHLTSPRSDDTGLIPVPTSNF